MCQHKASGADRPEEINRLGGNFQHQRSGMTHHLARQMEQAPAHGGHLVAQPAGVQGGMLEQDEQICGINPTLFTQISECLHPDRSAVKRDVDELERAGRVTIADKMLPGHGRMKEVRATANRFSLQAEVA